MESGFFNNDLLFSVWTAGLTILATLLTGWFAYLRKRSDDLSMTQNTQAKAITTAEAEIRAILRLFELSERQRDKTETARSEQRAEDQRMVADLLTQIRDEIKAQRNSQEQLHQRIDNIATQVAVSAARGDG